MRKNAGKAFWLAVLLAMMSLTSIVFGAGRPAQTLNLPEGGKSAVVDEDDETPEVTARVARISFVSGEVKIRRVGNDDWEKAVLNLPLIEGDEIATGANARLEMQLNNYVHIRIDHDSYLKFAVMKDEGVAVSLTQGTMNLRVTDLGKAGGYLEIDAPKTTVAVEKSGSYRIDAGKAGDQELHVSVNNGGSARVYSENAGFTLKSGRGARVFVEGDNAGEWETAEAAKFGDEFDSWSADRDSAIAKRLSAAYYDKYYDQDIYGADDLNDYGEWVYTSNYGYVWRPFDASLRGYADWSPYRYGHWRWLGPYGWTWVNDEPWGWATYHHGRWVYDRGHWVWSPYGYYRPKRSWWFPALVVINIINTNVCWYPLGYHHRWRNYNHHGGNGWGGHGGGNHSGNGSGGSGPIRNPPVVQSTDGPSTVGLPVATTSPVRKPPSGKGGKDEIPSTGISSVNEKDFGSGRRGIRAEPIIAKAMLDRDPSEQKSVDLPVYKRERVGNEIAVRKPMIEPVAAQIKTGAATRKTDAPLDQELRTTRILGGRQTSPKAEPVNVTPSGETPREKRPTGAVERPVRVPSGDKGQAGSTDSPPNPVRAEPVRKPRVEPVQRDESPKYDPPVRQEKPRDTPRYEQPVRQPRNDPPPVREQPKNDPPVRQPAPRSEPKSEPKPVEKPVRDSTREKPKDGR